MKKYWLIFITNLQNNLIYRFSFFLWHLRQLINFIVPLFVWSAVFQTQTHLYHYSLNQLMTYVFGTIILKSLVFDSQTYELASVINNGDLSVYLLKPINIFKYYFSRDLSNKIINLFFLVFELPLLFLIFKPTLIIHFHSLQFLAFLAYVLVALGLYFYLSFLFGLIGFWTREVWAPRFLLLVILEFATGSIFPLDMLPTNLETLVRFTPFAHMLYFPLKTYLTDLRDFYLNFSIALAWLVVFYLLANFIWQQGLRRYEAEGR